MYKKHLVFNNKKKGWYDIKQNQLTRTYDKITFGRLSGRN